MKIKCYFQIFLVCSSIELTQLFIFFSTAEKVHVTSFSFPLTHKHQCMEECEEQRVCRRKHFILSGNHDYIFLLSYKNTRKIKNLYKKRSLQPVTPWGSQWMARVCAVDWQVSQPTVFEPGGSSPPPVRPAWSECKTRCLSECRGSPMPEWDGRKTGRKK